MINLFESNIVNELIEANALTIGEDIVPLFNEIDDNGLKTINDYEDEIDSTNGSKYKLIQKSNGRQHESAAKIPID